MAVLANANFVPRYAADDDIVDYTNTSSNNIGAGGVIATGSLIAVAMRPIPAGQSGALCVRGVLWMPKATNDGSLNFGVKGFWDNTNQIVTSTNGGGANLPIGPVVQNPSSGSADAAVLIKLQQS